MIVRLPEERRGGVSSPADGPDDGVTMSMLGDAFAPAPTLEPVLLPLAAGLPPGPPGRVSLPPKPGTRVSGMGDWACAHTETHATPQTTRNVRIVPPIACLQNPLVQGKRPSGQKVPPAGPAICPGRNKRPSKATISWNDQKRHRHY